MEPNQITRVPTLIIEGNRLFREGLKLLLLKSQFEILWELQSLTQALDEVSRGISPELILIDGQDNYRSVADGVRLLRQSLPDTPIVIITHNYSAKKLGVMLEAGANAYLHSGMSAGALIQSLTLVIMGQTVFPTGLVQSLIDGSVAGPQNAPLFNGSGLSDREILILRCLASGDSNKLIAIQLKITEANVKAHLKAILRKLNLSNRTQAAIWAVGQGLEKMPVENCARTAIESIGESRVC